MSNNVLLARSNLGLTPLTVNSLGQLTVDNADIVSAVAGLGSSLANVDLNTDTLEAKIEDLNTSLTALNLNVVFATNNLGAYGNIANDITLNADTASSNVDISAFNYGSLFYSDFSLGLFDSVRVEVSPDGTNYMKYNDIYPVAEGKSSLLRTASAVDMCLKGLTNIRVVNNADVDVASNVVVSVVGSN
eukprot:m.337175 g.337175  ORF g.337175 m.337175 type:complete len:189 (+) comp16079_c3_seq17:351-917(+)